MELFYVLLVLLFVTRLFGEIVFRMGQPSLIGELLAGIALGVLASQFSDTFPFLAELTHNPVFLSLVNLGIFFLMLLGGVELRAGELAEASGKSLIIGISGLILPFFAGIGLAWCFIPESTMKLAQSLFVGTALAITAIPVSIGILIQMNKLRTTVGKTIVSAAIVDDVLSLVLLAVLVGIMGTGEVPGLYQIAALLGQIALFFLFTFSVAKVIVPRIASLIAGMKTAEFEFTFLIIAALTFSIVAETLHLHWILGAFVAGLLFEKKIAGEKTYYKVKKRIVAITTGFLAPIFFASIGMELDLSAFVEIPTFLFLMIAVAFISKLIGAGLPSYLLGLSKRDALAVGIGMSARGAVELIIATVALKAGLFSSPKPVPPEIQYLFSAVVIVAVVTTLVTPFALNWVFSKRSKLFDD